MRRGTPLTMTDVFWTFGSQRRLVFRFEWLTLCPNDTLLPHSSQRLDTIRGRLAYDLGASPNDHVDGGTR